MPLFTRILPLFGIFFLAVVGSAQAEPVFYLNAHGGERYTITRFVGQFQSPPAPVIGPENNGGASDVAWPSAFSGSSNKTLIYASRKNGGVWTDVGLWQSADGIDFSYKGAALSANASEPAGIGPSVVAFDESEAAPWHMIYLVRSVPVGTELRVADSISGEVGSWTRRGVAMRATEPWEAAGISPSYVFKDPTSGKWVLLYHAYETVDRAHAAMATADAIDGPFANKKILMSPVGSRLPLSGMAKWTNFGFTSSSPILGQPYILRQASPAAMEVAVPVKFLGGVIYFNRPVIGAYSAGEMAHVATNKVDPSFVERLPNGRWRGYWTGYGQFSGVTSEYTFEVEAPALEGPWSLTPSGLAFQPWTASGSLSTENPTPTTVID